MEKITIEQLHDMLNNLKNKQIEIILEGTISTKLKIKIDKILKTGDYIEIINKETEENIKLNIHQIMKIDENTNKEILIQFDGLQTIKILI